MELMTGTNESINDTTIFMHCQPTQDLGTLFLLFFMIIEVIVGLPGTVVALWIFCFRMKFWKPHTLFLFNLVLADFLLLISVPFRIDTHLRGDCWVFGHVWCRINLFMLAVNRSASIAFMTAVALERYFKVLHPHHCISRMTLTQAGWLAVLMWIAVIALRIPLVTYNLLNQSGTVSQCRSFNSYIVIPLAIKVHYVAFTAEFFLPWFLLLFCSARIACFLHKRQMGRQKRVRRAIRAVGVISLVFTICFMPSIVTGLGGMYIKYFYPKDDTSYNLITQLFMMCIGFTYLNSALDPVIYSFSSSMFLDALKSSFSFKKKNVRPANNPASNC
ncbi:hydroxycarboxylic acid receptor 3-like [Siniperca chuatsi]|uniref:hydroxycarboxylic acid receptor 3-like n=1 Tax=Siniperca chuatsi TaxID=119488 RepID=UPI001CE07D15|nr:hydroxycarboxylic acid receptor 3-like [Siniperca chuatsi]